MKRMACWLALGVAWSLSAHAQLEIREPWIRSTVPGQTVAGAFMEIHSARAVSLVKATTSAARSAEIHQTTMDGGVARMLPVERIDIPAGKTVVLKPGGYHLMLIDIAKPLRKGDIVPLSLVFEEKGKPAQAIEIKATVRDVMADHGQHKM